MNKLKKKTQKWKPVQLEGPLISADLDGLIGIEELTDYDTNIISSKKQQRKVSKHELKPESPPGQFVRNPNPIQTETTAIIKPKRKRKLKTKKTGIKNEHHVKKSKLELGETEEQTKPKCNTNELNAWHFVSLPEPILKALADLGFMKPTIIQELTLPPAIYGRRDILGAAETGSGKTLAFGLPILTGILKLKEQAFMKNDPKESELEESEEEEEDHNLNENDIGCVKSIDNVELHQNSNSKPLYALILTPTRELAIQIKNHLKSVSKYTSIKTAVVVGGLAPMKQERILSKHPEIVVATPGRLWELIQKGNEHLSQIEHIKYLAIDETDRMIEKHHFHELQQLLERLNENEANRKGRQNFVFSATLTLVHDLPEHLRIKHKLKNVKGKKKIVKMIPEQKLKHIIETLGIESPKVIDITQDTGTAQTLTECRINCEMNEKDYYVHYFLRRHPGRTLIFCNSIGCVRRLAHLLTLLRHRSLPLHASMAQRQRLKNVERFRDDSTAILVATDVAARGLDIPRIEHVLHYQTPRTSESYVHRSGRTARASSEGITVLLIAPDEAGNYKKLCHTLERSQDLSTFPVNDNILKAVKERVNLARQLDALELQTKRTTSENGWLQKAAHDMDIILDDDDNNDSDDENVQNDINTLKRRANLIRKKLESLLDKPILPRGFSGKYLSNISEFQELLNDSENSKQKAIDLVKNVQNQQTKSKKKKIN